MTIHADRASIDAGIPTPTPLVRFKRLSPRATLPGYQTEHAAGMDLSACLPEGETVTLRPGDIAIVPCGFAMAVPPGFEAQVRPRSGLASLHGVTMPNAPGTIDADYRGQVKVPIINHGRGDFTIEHGMRIAQMIVAPVSHVVVEEVDDLDDTSRGEGGFGSTGL